MKQYEKIYEDIIVIKPSVKKRFDSSKLHVPKKLSVQQYSDYMSSFAVESSKIMFGLLVKLYWLKYALRFRKVHRPKNDCFQIKAFRSYIMREMSGHDYYLFGKRFTWVSKYISILFPKLLNDDPFAHPEKYVYPYEHVTLDFLLLVYQLSERFELLEMAEKSKMKYKDFVNYVVNYVLCKNDESKKRTYIIKWIKEELYIKNTNYEPTERYTKH